jgi:hypothetical protein
MRIATCLVAVLCAATVGLAQQAIEWSAARRLSKEDFRGRVPPNAGVSSLSWIAIDTEWECEAGELFATARATFDPSRSWWRGAQGNLWGNAGQAGVSRAHIEARRSVVAQDMQLLDHEQLHFDLAELTARRIREGFATMKDTCAEPGATALLQEMVAKADRELQAEQARYDRETSHGVNARAQDQWAQRIKGLLN